MNRKDNRSYYDEFSHWYERERGRGYHGMLDDIESGLVLPHCPGNTVLDAGCGTGLILERVDSVARRAVGVDLSSGMLTKARERGLEVVQGSLTDLPFGDHAFDLVFSFKVLAHVESIAAAVRELSRVTRPGGRLFLEFYNPLSLRYLGKRVWAGRISEDTTEAAVFTRWDTPRRVRAHLPSTLELVAFHGVRVLTPMAALHRLPLVGRALNLAEKVAVDSPLRYFGGFLVAECVKVG